MNTPIFKAHLMDNDEMLLLWENPPGNDAEFTYQELCQYCSEILYQARESMMKEYQK